MPKVRGVHFDDATAPLVESLVERIERLAGAASSHLTYKNKLTFAVHPPDAKRKIARGNFVMIWPNGVVRRTHIPRTGEIEYILTPENVETVFKTVEHWYEEVRGLRAPVGFQTTENSHVLPGGQFESNKSKF